jgi:Holliday junction resolvase RusA-like endonuclease
MTASEANEVGITFTLHGQPVPAGRPRLGRGHAFMPKKTVDAEKEVGAAWVRASHNLWIPTGGIAVRMQFFVSDKVRRDVDNLAKTVLDGLTKYGWAWGDDSQVVALGADIYLDKEQPRTVVTVDIRRCDIRGMGSFVVRGIDDGDPKKKRAKKRSAR